MIPEKAIKKFTKSSHREIVAGHLLAYGFFPSTTEGIDKAKKFVEGLDRWIAPSNLPNYYDEIESDLMTGKETAGIINIRGELENFYFNNTQTSVEELPIEEIPVVVEIVEVEKQPDPEPEPVEIKVEVPVQRTAKLPKRIRLPRQRSRFVRKKQKSLAQRMSESFDKNLLDPLIEVVRNPPSGTAPKSKSKTTKLVSKKKLPGITGKSMGSGFSSSSSGDLVSRAFTKIGSSFKVAAAARRAFKESGGDPKSLRRGYFFSKAAKAEFGGDFIRRTKGTFNRAPDATQDPGLSKEDRFAAVLKGDLAARPQMVKQGELFNVDNYTDKTPLQSILDIARKTADKINGLESGFVRIEKSNKETSESFSKIKQNLTEVKNVYIKTADNFREFVENKEQVIKIKEKIRELKRKQSDKTDQQQAETQLELGQDVAAVSDVKETDQGLDKDEENIQAENKGGILSDLLDGGGAFLDDLTGRRTRIGSRRRLLRRKWSGFKRGFGRRFGGFGRRLGGLGRGIGGLGRGIGGLGRGIGGLGRGIGGLGRGIGGRFLGPILGDMIFPEGAGVTEPQMGPDGKFRTPDGRLVPEPGAPKPLAPGAPKPTGIVGKGKNVVGKVGSKIGSKFGGGLAKSIGKKIPGVGLIIGGLAAADRFKSGDNLGGIGEIASGVASLVPGVGTAISLGIDALLMGKDVAQAATEPEKKLASGGIVAGEAGNEAVIPLSAAPAKKALEGLQGGASGSILGAVGPLLSAAAGIVRNPLYGAVLGPTVNPILQPLLSQFKVPVYSGQFGSFKIGKLKAASTQSKGKSESMQKAGDNPMTSAFGWLGNLFKGIGGTISGAVGGIGDFFGGLFGRRRRRRNRPGPGPGPGSGGSAGASAGVWKPLLDLVASKESAGGGYEALNPSTTLPGATKMTISEVARAATQSKSTKGGSGAVGKYQQLPGLLVGRAKKAGLNPDRDLFSPANQDLIAAKVNIGMERGGNDWLAGKYSTKNFMQGLSQEFAVLPNESGAFAYGGQSSSIKPEDVKNSLKQVKTKYSGEREKARIDQVNPQAAGKAGPTAPGAVGDQASAAMPEKPLSTSSAPLTGVAGKSQDTASATPQPSIKDDAQLMASAPAPSPSASIAPFVMSDPDIDGENSSAVALALQVPRGGGNAQTQSGGGGFVVIEGSSGMTPRALQNARLGQA